MCRRYEVACSSAIRGLWNKLSAARRLRAHHIRARLTFGQPRRACERDRSHAGNKWQLPHEFPNQERGMDRLAGKASLTRAADVGSFARPPMRQETARHWMVASDGRAAQVALMQRDEISHTRDLEIGSSSIARFIRSGHGAPAADVLATVDPQCLQAHRFGGEDVMEDTLRRMQDLVLADTQRLLQISKRIVEIADVRLIGADVLRGDDPVELDAEFLVALGEGGSVDVRDDDELVVTASDIAAPRRCRRTQANEGPIDRSSQPRPRSIGCPTAEPIDGALLRGFADRACRGFRPRRRPRSNRMSRGAHCRPSPAGHVGQPMDAVRRKYLAPNR